MCFKSFEAVFFYAEEPLESQRSLDRETYEALCGAEERLINKRWERKMDMNEKEERRPENCECVAGLREVYG